MFDFINIEKTLKTSKKKFLQIFSNSGFWYFNDFLNSEYLNNNNI